MALQLTIDKLKFGNRFYAWSATVRAFLEAEDLWDVVDIGFKDTKDSIQKELRAKHIILCSVDVNAVRGIESTWSSKVLWDFLNEIGPLLPVEHDFMARPSFKRPTTGKYRMDYWTFVILVVFGIVLCIIALIAAIAYFIYYVMYVLN